MGGIGSQVGCSTRRSISFPSALSSASLEVKYDVVAIDVSLLYELLALRLAAEKRSGIEQRRERGKTSVDAQGHPLLLLVLLRIHLVQILGR